MLFERKDMKVLVYRETIDMRAGFERLHNFCLEHLDAKMNDGHAFVFFGKNRSRMKILVYDGTGLVLIAKRIERKTFMSHEELLGRTEISMSELRLIFHGSVLRGPVFGEAADREGSAQSRKAESSTSNLKEFLSTQREGFALARGIMNSAYRDDRHP